jgi:hypothetical protein
VYVHEHCQPGRYFAYGIDTKLRTCSHPALVDEWVARNCTLGTVYRDGADTYIRDCARPGKGKWASPKYENGVMVHIGICKKGAYNEDGYDSNLKPCRMPLLWEYAFEGCYPGEIFVDYDQKTLYEQTMATRTACALAETCDALTQAEHDEWAARVSTLETGRDTIIRPCSAIPAGEYVTTSCVKFGEDIHSAGSDLQTTPCTAPGPGEYAAVPCDPGRGWPMAYGLLDSDRWNGYCQNSYYGYLPNEYCTGQGFGLLAAHTTVGSCVETAVVSVDEDAAACASVLMGIDTYVIPASCTGSATTIPGTCTGTADFVAATCTGTADVDGEECDLDTATDDTAECPAGCSSTAGFYPICDLDVRTDGTDVCPAGCVYVAPIVPICDFNATTDDTEACPAGCLDVPDVTAGSAIDCAAVMTVADPTIPACTYIPHYDTTRARDGSVVRLEIPDFDPFRPLPEPEPEPEPPEPEPEPPTTFAPYDCDHMGLPSRWYPCADATGAITCVPRPHVNPNDGICGAVGMVALEPCGWRDCDVCHARVEEECVDSALATESTQSPYYWKCQDFEDFCDANGDAACESRCNENAYRNPRFDPREKCCRCRGGDATLVIDMAMTEDECASNGFGSHWSELEGCGAGCVPVGVALPPTWDGVAVPEPEPDPEPAPAPEPEPEPEPLPEPEPPPTWEEMVSLATAAGVAAPAVFPETPENELWLLGAMEAAAKTTLSECNCAPGLEDVLPYREIRPDRFSQEPEPPRFLDRTRQWYGGGLSNERVLWNAVHATVRGVAACPARSDSDGSYSESCQTGNYDNVTTFAPDDDGRGRDTILAQVSHDGGGWPNYVATARISGHEDPSGYFRHGSDRTLAQCEEPDGGYDYVAATCEIGTVETSGDDTWIRNCSRVAGAPELHWEQPAGALRGRWGAVGNLTIVRSADAACEPRSGDNLDGCENVSFILPGEDEYLTDAGGEWVAATCLTGSSNESGRDSWVRECSDWSDGLWQLGACIPGNHTHTGADRWLADCWGVAELGGVYSFEYTQVGGGYFGWLGGAAGSWWDDGVTRFLLAPEYDRMWWAGDAAFRHPDSCYSSPWINLGIFFGALAAYLIYSLYIKYNEDQQFILETVSPRGLFVRLVDGKVILEKPTAKTWKEGRRYVFKKGLQWRKQSKLYRGYKAAPGETNIRCVGAHKTCGPKHVMVVQPQQANQMAPHLGIGVVDTKLLKESGKLYDPEFKELLENNAGFTIKPGLLGYGGAVSLGWNGLTVRHMSGAKDLILEDESMYDDPDVNKNVRMAFQNDASFLISSWKEVKKKVDKQFKLQAKTARRKANPPIPPSAMERCAEGPVADLQKKKVLAYEVFEVINAVELPEKKGLSAVMPTNARKYAVQDDGPALSSSQMAAKRKAAAAAKAAAEAEYDYSDEYDEYEEYSEEEGSEGQIVPVGSEDAGAAEQATQEQLLLPPPPRDAAVDVKDGPVMVELPPASSQKKAPAAAAGDDGKPVTPPLDAPAEPTQAWPAGSSSSSSASAGEAAAGAGAAAGSEKKKPTKKKRSKKSKPTEDPTQELLPADLAAAGGAIGDEKLALALAPGSGASASSALAVVVPAGPCEVCRAIGTVPVGTGVCGNCGAKQKKAEVAVVPKRKKKEKKRAVPPRPYRTADDHDADMLAFKCVLVPTPPSTHPCA